MKTYEVRLAYRGVRTYLVQANDAEAAREAAKDRYRAGDDGEVTGTEWDNPHDDNTDVVEVVNNTLAVLTAEEN